MNIFRPGRQSLVLFVGLVIGFWGDPFSQAQSASPATVQTDTSDAILRDPRTAAELPTKTKLPTEQTIEVKRKETDHQIQQRLTHIAQSQEAFKKLQISVVEGIVTIKGDVEEQAYAKSFSALSEKVEGVIGVIDAMNVTSQSKTGLRLAQSEVDDLIHKFFRFLPYLVSCFVVLIFTFALGYGTYRLWFVILNRKLKSRPLLIPHLAKLGSLPVYLFGIYLILKIGGAAGLAATLVGGTGVFGIVLGLAGKNILENLLSSFMLTLRNPFKIGDNVIIGDHKGIVYGIDSRCTMLLNFDGVFVQIPNTTVLSAVIKNVTAHPVNRLIIDTRIPASIGFANFKKYFDQTLKLNASSILMDPKPKTFITDFTPYQASVQCQIWIDSDKVSGDDVRSNIMQSLQLLMKNDNESMEDVKESIVKTDSEPTENQVIQERTSQVRAPLNH